MPRISRDKLDELEGDSYELRLLKESIENKPRRYKYYKNGKIIFEIVADKVSGFLSDQFYLNGIKIGELKAQYDYWIAEDVEDK